MAKCDKQGCARTAEVAPKILVPTSAINTGDESKIAIILSLRLCRRCCASMSAQDQVAIPAIRKHIETRAAQFAKARRLPTSAPIFEAATVRSVKLNSDEYRRVHHLLKR